MTQEDKLEKAKELYPTANADQRYVLECLFPELAESEDERILEVIKHCIESRYLHTSTIKGISQKECFAWLEKQGEQRNKINSCKITFEDVLAVECSMKTAKITKGGEELYKILVPLYNKIHNAYLVEKQGEQKPIIKMKSPEESLGISSKEYNEIVNDCLYGKSSPTDIVEPKFKESEDEKIRKSIISGLKYLETELGWDAVGDVDILDAYAWLEKQGEEKPNPYSGTSFEYNGHTWGMCARDDGAEVSMDGNLKAFISSDASFIYPDIPQPNLAPKSALEEFKEEKADNANKVEQNLANSAKTCKKSQRMISAAAKEALYDKPAWSEEDDEMLDGIILRCEKYGHQEQINWLKSIKQRIKGE